MRTDLRKRIQGLEAGRRRQANQLTIGNIEPQDVLTGYQVEGVTYDLAPGETPAQLRERIAAIYADQPVLTLVGAGLLVPGILPMDAAEWEREAVKQQRELLARDSENAARGPRTRP
jgi:hypothetical protein